MVVADLARKKLYKASGVSLAEKVAEMKRQGKTWDIIDLLVESWTKENDGKEFAAYKGFLEETREVQRDRKFGRTENQDQDRRYIISMPEQLMYMIRGVFRPKELIMDREFFLDFAKRYPFFRIPEKL